ncbi:MAG: ribosome small subunit-dependent GTPase A, partial [Spirochaetota bacterium]
MQKEGTVVQVFGLYYTVDDGENRIDCFLRGKNRLNKSNKKYSNPVAVGDKVLFTVHGSDHREGSIVSVLPRMNLFSRKDSKKNTREDVIAANIDQVLIIQSFSQPQPNLRFVDRLAVRSLHEGIKPVLCVNKSDMASGNDLQDIYDYYTNSGLDIFITSAKNGQGLEALHEVMDNRRTLLAGSSGVGKTSLLNAMYQTLHLRTAAVS